MKIAYVSDYPKDKRSDGQDPFNRNSQMSLRNKLILIEICFDIWFCIMNVDVYNNHQ